jgi:hypothetical protein
MVQDHNIVTITINCFNISQSFVFIFPKNVIIYSIPAKESNFC